MVGEGVLSRGALDVTLHEGTKLRFALDEVDVRVGGASGRMIYLVSREHGSTATVDAPGFADALHEAADGALDAAIVHVRRTSRRRRSWDGILMVIAAVLAVALIGFVIALPRLVVASIDAIPHDLDRRLGDAVVGSVASDSMLAHEPILDDAVRQIMARLEPHVSHEGYVYRTRVLRSADVNAFALPGGQIVVCAGLLARAERPEAVAGVIAHELAHVTQRHGLRGMLANLGFVFGLRALFGQIDFLPGYAQDGALIAASRGFSRSEEVEADTIGVRTLMAAHVDPTGLADVFRTLSHLPGTQMPGMLSWMSTHPDHADRIANIDRLIREGGQQTYQPIEGVDWSAVRAAAGRVLAREPLETSP